MRAITLYQPWASLVAHGHKKYETRAWQTKYRGNIAIHASKRWTDTEKRWAKVYAQLYPDLKPMLDDLPFGAVLVACRLVDCVPTESIRDTISKREKMFGDYKDHRFAFELEIVKIPPAPILASGKQGIWDWQP